MRALLLVIAMVAAGCADGGEIEIGGAGSSGEPPAEIFAPTRETFAADVQPWMASMGCAAGGACHATPGGGAGYVLVTDVASTADVGANYDHSICERRLAEYGTSAQGRLLAYFCAGPGAANGGHQGKTATDGVCDALYAWAAEGAGAAPPCP